MAKILIADDLEQNRYLLEVLLTGHGHEVLSAANGEEALNIARSTPVDLIVSDILMPVKDGFTLCKEWRDDSDLKATPFVFYTATYTDQKDIDFGLSLGADLFLIKPMDPKEMMESLTDVLGRKPTEDPPGSRPVGESVYLQEYNQALIRKLEKKMLDLEAEIQTRRKTEAQLLRFKTAIENTDESIVITDPRGLVEYVNPSFEKTTGFMKSEALGRPITDLTSRTQDPKSLEVMWIRVKNGEPWRGHLTSKTKAGKPLELEVAISPISSENCKKDGYVSVIRDVTQHMVMEKQLAQAQKMEAIGTLAGGIAHDFNNILGAIIGYTQLALFENTLPPKTWEHLNSVLEACDRAKNLVEQILTFSRKAERKKVMVELGPLIKESQKFLRASLPSTIDIRLHLDTKVGYTQADPVQIQQVILNLCTNAVYAMRDSGGLLEIRLRRLELDETTSRPYPELGPGTFLVLSVSDTGCGMDSETLSKIFEPFFSTKDPGEGTGLGLSVAHGIVQANQGAISVYSELGRGTTFNVYFPEAEGAIQSEQKAGPAFLPGGNESILYVDDEPDLVSIGSQMLERLGYRVTPAWSGDEALEKFKQNPNNFDLVITDQTMRGRTGMELAAAILKLRPQLPFILCTGFSTSDTQTQAKALGIPSLLTKPIDFRELAQEVRKSLDGMPTGVGLDTQNSIPG